MVAAHYGRILGALAMIVFVGTVAVSSTGAFFSDTETSTGNTFTAGAIDLKIDNESYVTSTSTGQLVASAANSWSLSDLTNQLFFSFTDVKPGDVGQDDISLHVTDNDAWACMSIVSSSTPENGLTEPESEVDATAGVNDGELQNELMFAFWGDDGDNIFETGETIFKQGSSSAIFNGSKWALADSVTNVWGVAGPITGARTYYVGKAWCMGALTPSPILNNNSTTTNPLVGGGIGFTCNGATVGNASQTDGLSVDVSFEAVQSRNNANFRCVPQIQTVQLPQ